MEDGFANVDVTVADRAGPRYPKSRGNDPGELIGSLVLSLGAHGSIVLVVVFSALLSYCLPPLPSTIAVPEIGKEQIVEVKMVQLPRVEPPPVLVEAGESGGGGRSDAVALELGGKTAKKKKRKRAGSLVGEEYGVLSAITSTNTAALMGLLSAEGSAFGAGELFAEGGTTFGGIGLSGVAGGRRSGVEDVRFGSIRGRNIDRAVVRRLAHTKKRAIETCFYRAQSRDPNVRGQFVAVLELDPIGLVGEVSPRREHIDDRELIDCALSALATVRFPRLDQRATAEIELIFGR